MTNAAASQRLQKELMELMMSGADGISAFPDNDNLFEWVATVQGVENTVYEGLDYELSMRFGGNYPYEPPVVTFKTPCFHPNVDSRGTICLDILKESWSAVFTASQVLLSLQSLLDNPNNNSPLNPHAASLWADRDEYRRAVRVAYDSRTATIEAPA
jgi:ubiquitin-conjugating enzyme E2 C